MKLSEAANIFYVSMIGVKADTTVKWYQNRLSSLIDFLDDPPVDQVTLFSLESFRASLNRPSKANGRKGKVSPYTIHAHVRAQKRFFSFLYRRQIIEKNPADFLEKPRLPKQPRKGIKVQDAERMLEVSRDNCRDYAILLFIRDTGCRAGGVYNLLTDNLDIIHNSAIVREKGDKERIVFYTTETALALAMYNSIRENPLEDDHFFLSDTYHEKLNYSGVYQIFRRLAAKANVKTKFSPHQWRHAAARSWIKAGMNLKVVAEILGHGSEQVTGDIYGTLGEDELHELYDKTQTVIHARIK
ncbi:MAG: tyrosine-type recombinase/integrase [Flexilinea sp.]|nr:tyrosine-type recombinase/integrase [Flexilinea sp.]